jgi:hypothetical protein
MAHLIRAMAPIRRRERNLDRLLPSRPARLLLGRCEGHEARHERRVRRGALCGRGGSRRASLRESTGLKDYLLPIADREPLAWIIARQRTAVGRHRRREAEALELGDRIFLYTTRGCFRNPRRDRGRVIGIARVTERAHARKNAVRFGEREYPLEIVLQIEALAPRRAGVELAPLVDRLESIPNRRAWSTYMRRALVPLKRSDGELLARALEPVVRSYRDAAPTYKL